MITLRRHLIVVCSLLLFYLMISFCFAQQNIRKRNFVKIQGRRILPSNTTIMTKIVPSGVACVALCSTQETCCHASHDSNTQRCDLDVSCCPQSEPLPSAIMFRILSVSLSCQSGWHKFGNNCYYISNVANSWNDSEVTCIKNGSMLAEVKSSCENDFLKTKVNGSLEYWIGGTDIQNENLWIWSSSETKLTFFDWSPNQPNNYYGGQHCLEFNYKSAWNDKECALLRPFICEKSLLQ
ncbi:galactose-specific lectin nattectin-like [Mytilus edulis]|uniref:galactose-specific lectin nattectin-like n=1 Tax=Mytilus edulis TaxID=6550 RepID=UPI0039EF861C